MSFRIELETYRGPLDLLLYLVRKHEVELTELPLAQIAEQFLEFLESLEELDVNRVGDFLEVASTLLEMKSRLLLPQTDAGEPLLEDPREELVQRLLEYKKYRDAATMLEERSRAWQQRFPRVADDVARQPMDPADQPVQEVELWDLVSAFGRVVRESRAVQPSSIVYDDTPIHTYMQRIHERLRSQRRMAFSEMFVAGMHKSAMIGVFLAILELVRHHRVRTDQPDPLGEIWILPGDVFDEALDISQVDAYDGGSREPVESQPAANGAEVAGAEVSGPTQ